jgi:hypothetical protein
MQAAANQFNVAPDSTSGHFVTNCQVLSSNEELGMYHIKNKAGTSTALETSNHGTATIPANDGKGFSIITQVELNPYDKVFQRARD